ncbi:MAG: M23 family metallopeptidase, partial [Actinomycetes bacterium]|nr:M23 family metallopeptidase [Actinomycetes bacterium]
LRAAAAGIVLRAAPGPHQGRTGNQIIIDHGGGVTTRYGHALTGTMTVRPGDLVTAGQTVGAMGGDPDLDPIGAGSSTGCHLHFEVNLHGQAVNPSAYLLAQGVVLGTD